MRARVTLLIVAAAIAAGLGMWRCRTGSTAEPGAGSPGSATERRPRAVQSQARPDPTTLPGATIAGTIRDERGAPIPNARVCVRGYAGELADELLREPRCTSSGATGAYAIERLIPATYVASAAAARYQPVAFGEELYREPHGIRVRAGERKDGIDLVLRDGGVQLIGTVSDLTGGPIEKARVWGVGAAVTETDGNGAFEMWVKPGGALIVASAEGYADSKDNLEVPSGALARNTPARIDIVLTPESSLSGTVVDAASGEPIAGARVLVGNSNWGWESGETTFTDERGAFRVSRLIPKRYVVVGRTTNGYGRSEGSVLVGLAQHVDGIVVKVFPAYRIAGRILRPAKPSGDLVGAGSNDCEGGQVGLQDRAASRFLDLTKAGDGSHFADGVLPGTYEVSVYCPGALLRESYPKITLVDRDAVDLVWEVDTGATIRGRVMAGNTPVADVHVTAARQGKARDKYSGGGTASRRDGSFEITGLAAGTYKLIASSERGVVAKTTVTLELSDNTIVERELVLVPDDVGELTGTIVDVDGRPVGEAQVTAAPVKRGDGSETSEPSSAAGTFSIGALRPGDYLLRIHIKSGTQLRKPGTTDDTDRGERVTIRGGSTTTVRLVVEGLGGTITGTVVDGKGAPVGDAFITAARQSDAAGAVGISAYKTRWNWNEKPVLTSPEGTFTLGNLAPGKYAVRAYRRGGGEAIVEQVAVGGTAKLTIRATGSIAGTVRLPSGTPDDFGVTVRDFATNYKRREQFFRTGGSYRIDDLPKGSYLVVADTKGGIGQIELELAEGQVRSGADLALEGLVTLVGRVVEHGTTKPVAGISVEARRERGGGIYVQGDTTEHVSDEAGRFTLRDVPPGQLSIYGWGADDAGYASLQAYRTVRGSGTIDIGDVPILKRRIKGGETPGELGLKFAEQPLGTPPEKRERRVSFIDPQGPAARSGIEVGDVVIAVDGVDVRGEHSALAHTLLSAPPGTKVVLGLARGTTVTIVLAMP